MGDRAFVIMQIGAKDSLERKRADEIYEYVVAPALSEWGIEPYRADLDYSPGAITPKMISELLDARLVIADLTGRNPNVFYELGITHSFARPLISIADSVKSLPFDAKDERVIELGEYQATGLVYAQGESAKISLRESLKVVLADGYIPPSPLGEAAANRSLDQLAPTNPIAAELAQMRENLEEIRKRVPGRIVLPRSMHEEIEALRLVIEQNVAHLGTADFELLASADASGGHSRWLAGLRKSWERRTDPWAKDADPDPWASDGTSYSDEPPF